MNGSMPIAMAAIVRQSRLAKVERDRDGERREEHDRVERANDQHPAGDDAHHQRARPAACRAASEPAQVRSNARNSIGVCE